MDTGPRPRAASAGFRFAVMAGVVFLCQALPVAAQAGLGDPTRPTSLQSRAEDARAAGEPQWRLYSTLVAAQRRLAVINGRTVREGEMIDGARLVEVRPNGVWLERGGRRFELVLQPRIVKRPSASRP